jgi:hypothetical protein
MTTPAHRPFTLHLTAEEMDGLIFVLDHAVRANGMAFVHLVSALMTAHERARAALLDAPPPVQTRDAPDDAALAQTADMLDFAAQHIRDQIEAKAKADAGRPPGSVLH